MSGRNLVVVSSPPSPRPSTAPPEAETSTAPLTGAVFAIFVQCGTLTSNCFQPKSYSTPPWTALTQPALKIHLDGSACCIAYEPSLRLRPRPQPECPGMRWKRRQRGWDHPHFLRPRIHRTEHEIDSTFSLICAYFYFENKNEFVQILSIRVGSGTFRPSRLGQELPRTSLLFVLCFLFDFFTCYSKIHSFKFGGESETG